MCSTHDASITVSRLEDAEVKARLSNKLVYGLVQRSIIYFSNKTPGGARVGTRPEPWIMHYVVQSLANEVPALFLPSAIFGHIRSEGALLLCVVSWAGLSFICFSS